MLDVTLPVRSHTRREAMIEMQAYLRVWRVMNPDRDVKRVEEA